MNKKTAPVVLLSFLLVLGMLSLSACCPLFGPPSVKEGKDAEADPQVDEVIEVESTEGEGSEDQPVGDESDNETTDSEEEITEARKASFNFSDTHRALGALDRFTDYIGLSPGEKEKIQLITEPEGDNIHFLTDIEPEMYRLESDIIFSGSFILEIDPEQNVTPIEALFQCDSYLPEMPARILCSDEEHTEPILEWYVPFFVVADNIPQESETDHIQAAAGFDNDGDPSNNHQAHEMAKNDFWQGSDKVYAMNFSPLGGWDIAMYENSPEGFTAKPTMSIAVVQENLVAWLIPGFEIEVKIPDWLGSIHIGDEYFSPESTGANTTNYGNPLGLVSFDPDTRVSNYINPEGQPHVIPGPYDLCAWIGCVPTFDLSIPSISCECSGCTYDPDCNCVLFKRNFAMENPYGKFYWEYVAEGEEKIPLVSYVRYECICVEITE
jgi:hypothetical protein